jgi:hypothetical protein
MSNRDSDKPADRSFLSTMVAIAWSFIGLRRKKDFEQDIGRLNPAYVIIAALIGVLVFIGILVTIVNMVVP